MSKFQDDPPIIVKIQKIMYQISIIILVVAIKSSFVTLKPFQKLKLAQPGQQTIKVKISNFKVSPFSTLQLSIAFILYFSFISISCGYISYIRQVSQKRWPSTFQSNDDLSQFNVDFFAKAIFLHSGFKAIEAPFNASSKSFHMWFCLTKVSEICFQRIIKFSIQQEQEQMMKHHT